jgi:hypothetical protein
MYMWLYVLLRKVVATTTTACGYMRCLTRGVCVRACVCVLKIHSRDNHARKGSPMQRFRVRMLIN